MTAAEGIKTVVMIADLRIGISAGRAMVIEITADLGKDSKDLVDHSKIEDRNKLDPVDHSNNRDKDHHRKIGDLVKDKDLVDHSKIEDLRDLADHNNNRDKDLHKKIVDLVKDKDLVDRSKTADHSNKDHRDQDHHNNKDLKILHRPHRQRKDHKIKNAAQISRAAFLFKALSRPEIMIHKNNHYGRTTSKSVC
jgi:hypothetical protein